MCWLVLPIRICVLVRGWTAGHVQGDNAKVSPGVFWHDLVFIKYCASKGFCGLYAGILPALVLIGADDETRFCTKALVTENS